MNDLSSEARALLREARGFDEPSLADSDRIRSSVLAKVGIAVGAGAGITAATTSIAAAPAAVTTVLTATAMKIGAAIVIAGSLATGGYVALRPASGKRPPATEVTEAHATSAPVAPPAPVMPAPVVPSTTATEDRRIESAHAPHSKSSRRHVAPPPVERAPTAQRATPDLEGEARLLEQADADLRRGDANAALGRLTEHASKYPGGALREEREGMRVVALCRAGRAAEGNAAAERFLARSPRSLLATRIRAACGGD